MLTQTISTLRKRPGSRIKQVLSHFGIQPHFGCGCTALANRMDKVGSKKVLEEIDKYTDEMYESIKKWRSQDRRPIPQPPRIVVKKFIKWACG